MEIKAPKINSKCPINPKLNLKDRATAKYNSKTKTWVWEPVNWKRGKDNLHYSNRHYPKKFWHNTWDRTQLDVAGVILLRLNKKKGRFRSFYSPVL